MSRDESSANREFLTFLSCVCSGRSFINMQNSRGHCCSEPVKSAGLGCTLAYPPPADPNRLAPSMSESALSVWCSPSLFPIKNECLLFQLSLWSCVRFSVCLGMILATWLKETFVYRAMQEVLARVAFLGGNRECFVRTGIWHRSWASPRFACRAGLICCL